MFDLGWAELFVIAVVALIVIGPRDLPKTMRIVASWFRKARSDPLLIRLSSHL